MSTTTTDIRRVLFVDDELPFLEIIKVLMEAFSSGTWEVSIADTPSKAFSILKDQPMDLVVLDVHMTLMDGIQMLSMLNRSCPHVQKAVLTGYANEKYRAACLSNGAELFLEKPTNENGWESLFKALDKLARFKTEKDFRGVLRRVGLQDVIQMECAAKNSSLLEISDGSMTGLVFIANGQIVHAHLGDMTGEDAFNALMGLAEAQFNLKPFQDPGIRSISGAWESLLMEAARRRDEKSEGQGITVDAAAPNVVPLAAQQIALGAPASPPADYAQPEATVALPTPSASIELHRPKVEEFLICSAQGEVMHQWQCHNTGAWVNFFEFLSQRAQRVEQLLPLGHFDRLEIQNDDSRSIVVISADKGVMVRTRQEAAT